MTSPKTAHSEHRLPITVIVVDDGGYGMLRYAAERRFGRTFAVDLRSPDFAGLAGTLGISARSGLLDGPDLEILLSQAMAVDEPTLVALHGALVPPRMSILTPPDQTALRPTTAG
ncbi:MAG: thiamine pyrophosphate-dependent enzyme [Gemmatimonadales bacterium]